MIGILGTIAIIMLGVFAVAAFLGRIGETNIRGSRSSSTPRNIRREENPGGIKELTIYRWRVGPPSR